MTLPKFRNLRLFLARAARRHSLREHAASRYLSRAVDYANAEDYQAAAALITAAVALKERRPIPAGAALVLQGL